MPEKGEEVELPLFSRRIGVTHSQVAGPTAVEEGPTGLLRRFTGLLDLRVEPRDDGLALWYLVLYPLVVRELSNESSTGISIGRSEGRSIEKTSTGQDRTVYHIPRKEAERSPLRRISGRGLAGDPRRAKNVSKGETNETDELLSPGRVGGRFDAGSVLSALTVQSRVTKEPTERIGRDAPSEGSGPDRSLAVDLAFQGETERKRARGTLLRAAIGVTKERTGVSIGAPDRSSLQANERGIDGIESAFSFLVLQPFVAKGIDEETRGDIAQKADWNSDETTEKPARRASLRYPSVDVPTRTNTSVGGNRRSEWRGPRRSRRAGRRGPLPTAGEGSGGPEETLLSPGHSGDHGEGKTTPEADGTDPTGRGGEEFPGTKGREFDRREHPGVGDAEPSEEVGGSGSLPVARTEIGRGRTVIRVSSDVVSGGTDREVVVPRSTTGVLSERRGGSIGVSSRDFRGRATGSNSGSKDLTSGMKDVTASLAESRAIEPDVVARPFSSPRRVPITREIPGREGDASIVTRYDSVPGTIGRSFGADGADRNAGEKLQPGRELSSPSTTTTSERRSDSSVGVPGGDFPKREAVESSVTKRLVTGVTVSRSALGESPGRRAGYQAVAEHSDTERNASIGVTGGSFVGKRTSEFVGFLAGERSRVSGDGPGNNENVTDGEPGPETTYVNNAEIGRARTNAIGVRDNPAPGPETATRDRTVSTIVDGTVSIAPPRSLKGQSISSDSSLPVTGSPRRGAEPKRTAEARRSPSTKLPVTDPGTPPTNTWRTGGEAPNERAGRQLERAELHPSDVGDEKKATTELRRGPTSLAPPQTISSWESRTVTRTVTHRANAGFRTEESGTTIGNRGIGGRVWNVGGALSGTERSTDGSRENVVLDDARRERRSFRRTTGVRSPTGSGLEGKREEPGDSHRTFDQVWQARALSRAWNPEATSFGSRENEIEGRRENPLNTTNSRTGPSPTVIPGMKTDGEDDPGERTRSEVARTVSSGPEYVSDIDRESFGSGRKPEMNYRIENGELDGREPSRNGRRGTAVEYGNDATSEKAPSVEHGVALDQLVDRLYGELERKMRIETERRGL